MENEKKPTIIRLTKELHSRRLMRWRVTTAFAADSRPPYRLFVTVKGRLCADESNPKLGMVMDFES